MGATNLSTFVVYYFQARLGYEKTEAASPAFMLQLFVGVFILLSALPAGWLSDRFGKKRMAMISGVIGAVGTAVALSVPSLPVIYVGGSIIGIATGLFFTANWALGTVLVPKEEAGRYLGISNLAGAGAGAVGAYIGGPIADFVSARAAGADRHRGTGLYAAVRHLRGDVLAVDPGAAEGEGAAEISLCISHKGHKVHTKDHKGILIFCGLCVPLCPLCVRGFGLTLMV